MRNIQQFPLIRMIVAKTKKKSGAAESAKIIMPCIQYCLHEGRFVFGGSGVGGGLRISHATKFNVTLRELRGWEGKEQSHTSNIRWQSSLPSSQNHGTVSTRRRFHSTTKHINTHSIGCISFQEPVLILPHSRGMMSYLVFGTQVSVVLWWSQDWLFPGKLLIEIANISLASL